MDRIACVCLKVGNKFGPHYVNRLANMIERNTRTRTDLICITDDPTDLIVPTLPALRHEYLRGWWHKVALFGGYKFDADRIVFFDLDTIILDWIDFIFAYDGDFAILRDFYYPKRQGSAIMSIRKGYGQEIWDKFVTNPLRAFALAGDQDWIESANDHTPDLWQELYPNRFVSYKVHCQNGKVPQGAAVVCFHGLPKNDDVNDQWVKENWR